jgi:hypothetical protein
VGKNPFLRTLVIVVLAGGVGAYLWFVESKKQATTDEKPAEKVFAGFEKAKVKAITLARTDGETLALVREGDGWKMTQPIAVAADSNEVDSLLSSVESLEVSAVANANATSLTEYGLAPAHTTATLGRDGGEPVVLLLGDKAPADSGVYAKIPSSPRVFTVLSTYESAFEKKAFDLRDRDVLHVRRDDVKSIAVTGPQGAYALTRGDGNDWAFTAPFQSAAARWSVDSFIGSLESLRMDSVADENAKDLAAYGLSKPERTVALTLASGTQKTLEIGKATTDGKHYARDSATSLVVVVPKVIAEDLSKGMNELRAKRVLDVAAYEVESLEIDKAGSISRFAKANVKDKDGNENETWKLLAGGPGTAEKAVESGKLEDVLFKMGGVEATTFIDKPEALSAYGLDKPILKATVQRTEGKGATWFEVGRAGTKTFVRRASDAAVLEVDPAKVDELMKAVDGL